MKRAEPKGTPLAAPRPLGPLLRSILAMLPPLAALLLQLLFWPTIQPYVWFLFYPAVFISSWIGGLVAGLGATVLSTLLVRWFFVSPRYSFATTDSRFFLASVVFIGMGVLFSLVHGRLKRATRQANEALEATRQANEKLREANDRITVLYEKTKQLDDLKSQFFANVSHEMRTPLALILGPTERLLKVPGTTESARHELEVVVRNARTLLRHVNDLLDVSKLEAARMRLEYADADLARLVRFVAGHFEVLAAEKRMTFLVEAPDELRAQVDPNRLARVVLNLLSNAFKFTPAGGRIRLTLREVGERVRLEVADSGPGIPPAMRETVFERFRQLEGGATRRFGGTGLGLAIARDFVELHGGAISANGAPEGGALFVVDLPRKAPPGEAAAALAAEQMGAEDARQVVEELRSRPEAAPVPSGGRGEGLVLVVEDNREMNRFLCETLASDRHVVAAFDGREGLSLALELKPDLILTDIMMPEMSGDELVYAIRSHSELDQIPILLLTAKADEELRIRLLREGAQDYLMKPFAVEELRARISNLIDARLSAERLHRSEERVRELVEQAPDGIFVADLEGRYTDVNSAGCRMLGYTREEIVGKTIVDLIPPEEVDRLWQSKEVMLGGVVQVAEWALRRKDGSYLPVEVSAKILPDGRWQGFVRDITERKRAEEALRLAHEAEHRLRAELEEVTRAGATVAEAVAELPRPDVSAVLHTIALQAQALTQAEFAAVGVGNDPEKPFDPWVFVGISSETAAAIGRSPRPVGVFGSVARNGRSVRMRDIKRHPSFGGFPPGHPEMKSFLGVPIRYHRRSMGNLFLANKRGAEEFSEQDERLIRMLADRAGVAIETAMLYAEEALHRTWLETISEQMPEGVVLLDEHGAVVLQNRTAVAYSRRNGCTDGHGHGIPYDLRDATGAEVRSDDHPLFRAMARGEGTVGAEFALVGPEGERLPVLFSATPVRIDSLVAGVVGVFQDISPMKELERLREEWTSVVAHDLRQPVSAISITAEMLLKSARETLSEKQHKALETILSAVRRLERMIHDLLDASRIEARRLTVKKERVLLPALVGQVLEEMRGATEGYTVAVHGPVELFVQADPERIVQVVSNLLSNAAKYGAPDSEIRIDMACQGDRVETVVTNHGPGIPPEEMPVLFSRFMRTRVARAGGASGLGLGLYICKGIVEAHGGRLWAESTPGDTTSFHFTLPLAGPDEASEEGGA